MAQRHAEPDWARLIGETLMSGGPRIAFQPVVDLGTGGIAGYEALARFEADYQAGPDEWFAAARTRSRGPELEARAIRTALESRHRLPAGRFLAVNVSPDLLSTDPIRKLWRSYPDLRGVIVELNEQVPIEYYDGIRRELSVIRDTGAIIAVDDAGAGYAGMRHLLALRPSVIKLDRELIVDVDRDEAKIAVIELMRDVADRLDAWIIAEGVERIEELDVLVGIGVPFAQGFALAEPAFDPPPLHPDAVKRLSHSRRPLVVDAETLGDLVEVVQTAKEAREAVRAFTADAELRAVVVVDPGGHPVALVNGDARTESSAMPRVSEGTKMRLHTPVADALKRALTRPPRNRFEPLLATDDGGKLAGIIWLERLISAVTAR